MKLLKFIFPILIVSIILIFIGYNKNMKSTKKNKIVLIGCGAVGTAYIYAVINQSICGEFVLIDINENVRDGNLMDLQDTIPLLAKSDICIKSGNYLDCKDADLVVVVAGRNQKPDETRLDLLKDNTLIIKQIIKSVMQSGFKGKFLVASNPVDIMTYVVWKISKLPSSHIIGSGTILDSSRFVNEIANANNICVKNISNAYVIGEHGDSSLCVFSQVLIKGKPLSEKQKNKKAILKIQQNVRKRAYRIIKRKKVTNYGIGVALQDLTKDILGLPNSNKAMVCDIYFPKDNINEHDFYIGFPCKINTNGAFRHNNFILSEYEQKHFDHSKKVIIENIKLIEDLLI